MKPDVPDNPVKPGQCVGSGLPATNIRGVQRGSQTGECVVCWRRYRLTYERTIRHHGKRTDQ